MSKALHTSNFSSPLGEILLSATSTGLCRLEFKNSGRPEKQNSGVARITEGKNHILDQTKAQLNDYFAGTLKEFTIPIDPTGTEFQFMVWNELLKIPYGATRTYKEQAIAVGNIRAIRAVAKANGDNPIAIIIPCHRVIGSDNSLVGYAGGLWRKQELLQLESAQTSLL